MSAWREELEASKRRLAPPGPLPFAEIADWPGERIFAAIGAGELPSPEFAVAAGIHPIEVGGGRAVFQGDPSQAFRNIMGAAHGGWIATLLDTALAVAVGVRDAGHLGMESIVALLPRGAQRVAEALIHVCVIAFAVLMAMAGWEWLTLKWDEPKPMLGVPEGLDFLPLVIAGALIVLFCIEHLIALWRGQRVESAGV